jgi:hypothetical protein
MAFTAEDLIKAIEEEIAKLKEGGGGGATTGELAESLGLSRETTLRRIRPLAGSGVLVSIELSRPDVHGRMTRVKGWSLPTGDEGLA